MAQKDLKLLWGAEIKGYAIAHNMTDPIEERNRCWRVFYADAVSFHLDSLPCIPEDQHVIAAIVEAGTPARLAAMAVASTDPRASPYEPISSLLFSSTSSG